MDYFLDYLIKFEKNDRSYEHSWALFECGKNTGKIIDKDLVPWIYSLHFEANELLWWMDIQKKFNSDIKEYQITKNEVISGRFKPSDLIGHSTLYYMMGTDRKIDILELRIEKIKDEDKETCYMWGSVAYESEWDFVKTREPDALQLYIYLNASKFDELKNGIVTKAINSVGLTLSQVSGFYSHPSPSIRAYIIKILTDVEGKKIDTNGIDIKIPVLGEVGQFSLRIGNTTNGIFRNMIEIENLEQAAEEERNQREDLTQKYLEQISEKLNKLNLGATKSNSNIEFYLKIIAIIILVLVAVQLFLKIS
jgi:hypothetical protein